MSDTSNMRESFGCLARYCDIIASHGGLGGADAKRHADVARASIKAIDDAEAAEVALSWSFTSDNAVAVEELSRRIHNTFRFPGAKTWDAAEEDVWKDTYRRCSAQFMAWLQTQPPFSNGAA